MQNNRWFLESIRRLFDYQFPPSGRLGNKLFQLTTLTEFTTELFPGIQVPLDMREELHKMTYWYGRRYEYPTGWLFDEWCRGARAFFDIGSNYGFYSWWIASAHPEVEIHLFEPNPGLYPLIDRIINDNQLGAVHLHKFGLADEAATLRFTIAENSGCSTFGKTLSVPASDEIEARVMAFDTFCSETGLTFPSSPTWVAKIDAEGFDLKVLYGMEQALGARAFKAIAIEASDARLNPNDSSSIAIEEMLGSHGFRPIEPKINRFWSGASVCENRFFILQV